MFKLSQKDAYRLMLKEYPDVMTVDQISEALDVSKKTIYELLKTKAITPLKVGRAYRIPKLYLLNYLKVSSETE